MGAASIGRSGARAKKTAKKHPEPAGEQSRLAQVRLRGDELESLREAMRVLDLSSTSEALREGLRLLTIEAAEIAAADELHAYYGGEPAPLPDGVSEPTAAELLAADETEW
jgi:uncharacterized protein YciW